MSTFSIDQAALTEIQRIFDYSEHLDPVAQLYESRDAGHLFDATLAGATKTTEELGVKVRKRFAEVESEVRQLKISLMVGAAERSEYRSEHLHKIAGITFGLDPRIVEALHNYCLTFKDGQFIFKGADNSTHILSSILTRKKI